MNSKLYVGNLSYDTSESDLRNAFGEHGSVGSAQIVMDRDSGRSKGFGFVQMGSDAEASAAIEALHGQSIHGRALTVNVARPMESRGNGGGFKSDAGRPRRY
ncbi:MAG: RNA-binding protein [Burkholderiaceae bacterium]|nr:RNA-binding protein [Burkholderiaceae bacterium]